MVYKTTVVDIWYLVPRGGLILWRLVKPKPRCTRISAALTPDGDLLHVNGARAHHSRKMGAPPPRPGGGCCALGRRLTSLSCVRGTHREGLRGKWHLDRGHLHPCFPAPRAISESASDSRDLEPARAYGWTRRRCGWAAERRACRRAPPGRSDCAWRNSRPLALFCGRDAFGVTRLRPGAKRVGIDYLGHSAFLLARARRTLGRDAPA